MKLTLKITVNHDIEIRLKEQLFLRGYHFTARSILKHSRLKTDAVVFSSADSPNKLVGIIFCTKGKSFY